MAVGSPPSRIIRISDFEWKTLLPGIHLKQLLMDEAGRRRATLNRFDPGAEIPLHRHRGDELIYVIEGVLSDSYQTITPGDVGYRPNQCAHRVFSTPGATLLALVTGDSEPAGDAAGSPPSTRIEVNQVVWSGDGPIRSKPIWDDPAAQRRCFLVRLQPGARIARHRHLGDELAMVIEGSIHDESGEVLPGHLSYRPNGCVHSIWSERGATVLVHAWGGYEPV